jgi:hypothetical protein
MTIIDLQDIIIIKELHTIKNIEKNWKVNNYTLILFDQLLV